MTFQDIFDTCDCVATRDLIRIDTYPYLDKDVVKFDNYHNIRLTSQIEVVYNAVNVPFGFAFAIQEACVTKNFDWFHKLIQDAWTNYDTQCLPNYAVIKYKDYNIGKLYGVTHYKELFACIERFVF